MMRKLSLASIGGVLLLASCSKGPAIAPHQGTTIQAILTVSEGASYDFGPQFIESVTEHTFTVTNSGNGPASQIGSTLFVSAFSFKGGKYPGSGGNCGTGLDAGAACTLVIAYAALYQSEFTETLSLS